MILHVLNRNLRICCGTVWGVSRPAHPPLRSMTSCCGRSRGVGEAAGLRGGRKNYLHTHSPSCTAFTWSRRKRKRELEGFVSISCPSYSTYFSKSTGIVEEVKDDEAQQLVVTERGEDGEFHDTQHHYRNSIKERDVGAKVNVGEPVIYELQHLFNIPRVKALKMVRFDNFLLVSDKAILKTLYFLKDQQICPEQLQRIPWLLVQSPDTLQPKFEKLLGHHLFLSLKDGLGFCFFSLQEITKFQRGFVSEAARFPNHPNRVYYVADRMKMPVPLVTEKIVKPKSVIRMDVNKMNQVFEMFNKYGVQMKHVLQDMWVFCHNVELTDRRLRQAVEAGCKSPKPWICHASPHVFERYLERLSAKKQVLGENGRAEIYVSERLQCPVYEVEAAFRRNRSLKQLHVGSMKIKLDLLFESGFTAEEIRGCLRVLQYPITRAKARIEEMKSLGEERYPITLLFKQPKTYFNIVQKIKREKREAMMKKTVDEKGLPEKNEEESSEGKDEKGEEEGDVKLKGDERRH